jgi:hypothetical protein
LLGAGLLTQETSIYLHSADQPAADEEQGRQQEWQGGAASAAAGLAASAAAGEAAALAEESLPQSMAATRGRVVLLNAR